MDLQIVSETARRMESNKSRDPRRALTVQELAEVELAANMQVERANEQFAIFEAELAKEFNRLHGWRLTQDTPPAFIDLGKARAIERLQDTERRT
jgi:hypothetical protein